MSLTLSLKLDLGTKFTTFGEYAKLSQNLSSPFFESITVVFEISLLAKFWLSAFSNALFGLSDFLISKLPNLISSSKTFEKRSWKLSKVTKFRKVRKCRLKCEVKNQKFRLGSLGLVTVVNSNHRSEKHVHRNATITSKFFNSYFTFSYCEVNSKGSALFLHWKWNFIFSKKEGTYKKY